MKSVWPLSLATSDTGRHGLGVVRGSALYIGALIGPGLLLAPALAMRAAGPASIIAWAALLVLSVPLALTFAALGARHPVAGGVSAYVREGLGDAAAAVSGGWFLAAVLLGAPTVSVIGGYYVADLTGSGTVVASLVGLGMFVTVLTANFFGLRVSSGFQLALAAVLVVVVAIALAMALPSRAGDNWAPFTPHGWWAVGTATNILVWLFVGWEAVAQLAGDFRHPAADLPRAIGLAFTVVTLIYVGLAVATIGVTGGAVSRVPLADLISAGFGRVGRDATAVLAVALTMGTMNVYLGGAAKLAATLAGDGVLPAWLAGGGGRSVPRRSLGAIAVIGGTVLLGLLAGVSTTTDLVRATSALFIAVYGIAIVSAIRILNGHARLAAIASLGGVLGLAAFSTGFLAVPLVAAAIALVLRQAVRPPARVAAPPPPALERLLFPLLASSLPPLARRASQTPARASDEAPMSEPPLSGIPAQQARVATTRNQSMRRTDMRSIRCCGAYAAARKEEHVSTKFQSEDVMTHKHERSIVWTVAITSVALFMVSLDNLVVTTALPVIRQNLHATISQLEWTVNAYTLTFAVLLLTGAALGDRFGRRRMFVLGLLLFTGASAAAALSTSANALDIARALQGVGAAIVTPLTLTILSAAVARERRGLALGIWGGIGGLAIAIGPLVGGAIVNGVSWHWIFWLNVPIGLALAPLARARLEETRGPAAGLDLPGVALASAGLLGIVWGLVRGNEHGWTSTGILIPIATGIALLAAFVACELRAKTPMLPMHFFRSRTFALTNVASLLMFFGMFGSIFLLAQFFQTVQHYSPLQSGLRILPWTAMPIFVAPIAGALSDRIGGQRFMTVGLAFQAAGLAWIAAVSSPTVSYSSLVVPFVLSGTGMALFFAPVANVVLSSVRPEHEGKASGATNAIRELGGVFGVAVLASIFAQAGGYQSAHTFSHGTNTAVIVGAAVVAAGSLAAALIRAPQTQTARMTPTTQSAPPEPTLEAAA